MDKKQENLSDFGFDLVVTHFKLGKEQQSEHAAMRAVFRECVSHICTFSDAAMSRRQAANLAIQRIEPGYRLFLLHADDFFKDRPNYNKDALAIAVIAGDLLLNADIDEENFAGGIDNRTMKMARRICEDCSAIREEGHFEDYAFLPESFFLLHPEALAELSYLELHFQDWSLEELEDKQADGFSLYKKHLRPDTTIGADLSQRIEIVENKISAFIGAESRKPAPKPTKGSVVVAFPAPKR